MDVQSRIFNLLRAQPFHNIIYVNNMLSNNEINLRVTSKTMWKNSYSNLLKFKLKIQYNVITLDNN
jgi:hypothetical protein